MPRIMTPVHRSLRAQAMWGAFGLVVMLSLASWGAGSRVLAQAEPVATPEPRTMVASVYFLRDEQIGAAHREIEIPETKEVGAEVMRELLAGPTDEELDAGLTTAIPDDTEFLDLAIDSETMVATVDLSGEFESGGGTLAMMSRLAQVVFTLTQFDTVDSVQFQLDGQAIDVFSGEGIVLDEPLGRDDFEDLTPLIFVESPAVGDSVSSPLHIHGTANTFEATFFVQILDEDDQILIEEMVMATSGSGVRGEFDVEIPFDLPVAASGTIVAFEYSPRDGQPVNIVEIPVELERES